MLCQDPSLTATLIHSMEHEVRIQRSTCSSLSAKAFCSNVEPYSILFVFRWEKFVHCGTASTHISMVDDIVYPEKNGSKPGANPASTFRLGQHGLYGKGTNRA